MYQRTLDDGEPWEVVDMNTVTGSTEDLQRDAVSKAQSALNGVMREKMKPSDVDYAQRLIRNASSRELTQTEIGWLYSFAQWYDSLNRKFWTWWESGGESETRALQAKATTTQQTAAAPKTTSNTTTQQTAMPSTPSPYDAMPEPSPFPWKWVLGGVAVAGTAYIVFKKKRKKK